MSYNSLTGTCTQCLLCNDNAANGTVVATVGVNGFLANSNTADNTATGPYGQANGALTLNGTNNFINTSVSLDHGAPLSWSIKARVDSDNAVLAGALLSSLSQDYFLIGTESTDSTKGRSVFNGYTDGVEASRNNPGFFDSTNDWATYTATWDGSSDLNVYKNGILAYSETLSAPGTGVFAGRIGSRSANYLSGTVAESITALDTVYTSSEVLELHNGPEPTLTSNGALFITENIAEANFGTWDAQDNGSLSYSVSLRENGVEIETYSGTSTSTTFSGSYDPVNKRYELFVRASNDGGYDETLGPDVDGYVLVARYGLQINFLLDDNRADAYCLNSVARDYLNGKGLFDDGLYVVDPTFGDVPAGWQNYYFALTAATRTLTGGNLNIAIPTSSKAGYVGLNSSEIIQAGVNYVVTLRYRVNVINYAGAQVARLSFYRGGGGVWERINNDLSTAPIGEWVEVTRAFTGNASGPAIIATDVGGAGISVDIDIQNLRLYSVSEVGTIEGGDSAEDLAISDGEGPGRNLINVGMDFDGSADYIDVTQDRPVPFVGARCFSCWAKPDTVSTSNTMAHRVITHRNASSSRFGIAADNGSWHLFGTGGSSLISSPATAGEWTHLLAQTDGTTHYLYINNVLVGTSTGSLNPVQDTDDILVGSQTNIERFFDGALADARIYAHVLNANERQEVYSQGAEIVADLESNLELHLPLDDSADNSLVRDTALSETVPNYGDRGDFNSVGSADAYGDIPSGGWQRQGDPTNAPVATCSVADGIYTISLTAGADGEKLGINTPGMFDSSQPFAVKVRYRITSITGSPELWTSSDVVVAELDNVPLNEWRVVTARGITDTPRPILVLVGPTIGDAATIEVDYFYAYDQPELNGGDNTEDKQATGPGSLGAMTFNGTDDYILFPEQTLTGEFTFACWSRVGGNYARPIGLASSTEDRIYWSPITNSVVVQINNIQDAFNFPNIAADQFNLLVVTRDSSGYVRVYINDIESTTAPQLKVGDWGPLDSISRQLTNFSPEQSHSDWYLFSRELNSSEITELYLRGKSTYLNNASLDVYGNVNCGLWNNGPTTYNWVIADSAGNVIDSGTQKKDVAQIITSQNTVYLLVRVSNNTGYYTGDYATRTSAYGSSGDGYYELAEVALNQTELPKATRRISVLVSESQTKTSGLNKFPPDLTANRFLRYK